MEGIKEGFAALKAAEAPLPTIIYASRTHSQLAQVMGELRNTAYRSFSSGSCIITMKDMAYRHSSSLILIRSEGPLRICPITYAVWHSAYFTDTDMIFD